MHTITNTQKISSTPARVIEALSTVAGNRAWWTVDTTSVGDLLTFRFRLEAHEKAITFRVDRADDRAVSMTCIAQTNNPDWLGTVLTYDLSTPGEVTLRHEGYPAINECYSQCVKGWAHFMTSLKSYLETGRGTPFQVQAAA